jgi:predicted phosphodiesterase
MQARAFLTVIGYNVSEEVADIVDRTDIRAVAHALDDAVEHLLVVSDIHAHLAPLEAFDRLRAGYGPHTQVAFNGDLFFGGPRPREAAEWLIRTVGELATIGNHDRPPPEDAGPTDPPYTERGAYQRLTAPQREYFYSRPHRVVLSWRGKQIVLTHGHLTMDRRPASWMALPAQQISDFLEDGADLCTIGHTHYPFQRKCGKTIFANSGSMSATILGVRQNGGLYVQNGDAQLAPDADPRTSFLHVTVSGGRLRAEIVRFEFDQEAALADLKQAGYQQLDVIRRWMQTGILDVC